MSDTEGRVRDALQAQGINAPGPKLVALVMDSFARAEEQEPGGERTHAFDYAELLADTPALIDRTTGPLDKPEKAGAEMSDVIADVLNNAMEYLDDDDDS